MRREGPKGLPYCSQGRSYQGNTDSTLLNCAARGICCPNELRTGRVRRGPFGAFQGSTRSCDGPQFLRHCCGSLARSRSITVRCMRPKHLSLHRRVCVPRVPRRGPPALRLSREYAQVPLARGLVTAASTCASYSAARAPRSADSRGAKIASSLSSLSSLSLSNFYGISRSGEQGGGTVVKDSSVKDQ